MHDKQHSIEKVLSVWLILKSETTSGNIKCYRSKLPVLAAKCKTPVAEFEIFIAWLTDEGLVHVKEGNLLLHSYRVLKKYKAVRKDAVKMKSTKKP